MAETSGPTHDIIVIGGSTGGIEALTEIIRHLPENLSASLFVTVHLPPAVKSYLPGILARSGSLPARSPTDVEKIEKGVIYVAPPDRHLLIDDGHVKLSNGPRENRHRPAIDPMFRSAARSYGPRVVGVVLSGELDDGSSGLMAIDMRGGITIVQEPIEALASEMPKRAIRYAHPDHVLPTAEIARLLTTLSTTPIPRRTQEVSMPAERDTDKPFFESESDADDPKRLGKPSAFACPECHGVLWEVQEGQLLRFRCRVGHAYTADALSESLSETTEAALWAALRVLEEKVALLHRLAGGSEFARYKDQARGYEEHIETIKNLLKEGSSRSAQVG